MSQSHIDVPMFEESRDFSGQANQQHSISIKQEFQEVQHEEVVTHMDEENDLGKDSYGLDVNSTNVPYVDDTENTGYSEETPADSPDRSESDHLVPTTIDTSEPVPVMLPPESVCAILDSLEMPDANPKITEALGHAALQQLRQIVLVASQVAFHSKASGIRSSDFTYALKHLNNSTGEILQNSSVFEDTGYELSFNGVLVPGQGPAIQTRSFFGSGKKYHQRVLKQLREPPISLSVQNVTFHKYQEDDDSESGCDELHCASESEKELDENLDQGNDDSTFVLKTEDGEATFENESESASSDSDESDSVSDCENNKKDDEVRACTEHKQKADECEITSADPMDTREEEVKLKERGEEEDRIEPASSELSDYVETLIFKDPESVSISSNINEDNNSVQDSTPILMNMSDGAHETATENAEVDPESKLSNEHHLVNGHSDSPHQTYHDCNNEESVSDPFEDAHDEPDEPEVPSVPSSSSESFSDEEIDEEEPTLASEWFDYMKVLTEEFIKLGDLETRQLQVLDKDRTHKIENVKNSRLSGNKDETSEFSIFIEDISKNGMLPAVLVWCDFCRDFLDLKFYPNVTPAHLNGMLNVFEAMLRNRLSECMTSKQMKEIFVVLTEVIALSPPWEIHRHLASVIGLVIKKVKDDILVQILGWICSFVTETCDWFVNSTCTLHDWDHKCRTFNVALLIVIELEQLGYHFMQEFRWQSNVANVINVCEAIGRTKQLVFENRVNVFDEGQTRKRKSLSMSSKLESFKEAKETNAGTSEAQESENMEVEAGQESSDLIGTSNEPTTTPAPHNIGEAEVRHLKAKAQQCKDIIHQMLNSVDRKLAESLNAALCEELKSDSEKSMTNTLTKLESDSDSKWTDEHPFENTRSNELQSSEGKKKTMIMIEEALNSLQDTSVHKRLRTKLRNFLRNPTTAAPPCLQMEASSMTQNINASGGTVETVKFGEGIDISLLKDGIHQDMEDTLLLFYKMFLQNYVTIAPAPILMEAQKLASSYFGDRINQFVSSSNILSCIKSKRRKLSQQQ